MGAAERIVRQDRRRVLERMEAATQTFYGTAAAIGVHQFLEFTGMLREYIKILSGMNGNGVDFVTNAPRPAPYNMAYIAEKLDCIFGDAMRSDPGSARGFVQTLADMGWPVRYVEKRNERR